MSVFKLQKIVNFTTMKKIEFIAPISKKDAQRATVMLKTVNAFFDSASLELFTLLVTEKEMFEDLVHSLNLNFPVRVVLETDLIPRNDLKNFQAKEGWVKQQILKMLACRIVKTDFYICMDADVICFKKTDFDALVRHGKPLVNLEPRSCHELWWKDSAHVLGIPECASSTGMGVTPSILIRDPMSDMIDYIEKKYNRSFVSVLTNWWWEFRFTKRRWTEFTLYWSYLEFIQKTNLYTDVDVVYGKSIWHEIHASEDTFSEIFNQKNAGYFTVCQSTGVSDSTVKEMVEKYLQFTNGDQLRSVAI